MKRLLIVILLIGLMMASCGAASKPTPGRTGEWLLADLHVHADALTPQQVVELYENAGFDILAITDYDRLTKVSSDRLIIIPGLEWRVPGYGEPWYRHLIMLFVDSMPASVSDARRQGAIISIAHPITWQPPSSIVSQANAYEAYNGELDRRGWPPYWKPSGRLARQLKGKTGGSDAHTVEDYGTARVWIYAERNLASIKQAIMAGRVKVE